MICVSGLAGFLQPTGDLQEAPRIARHHRVGSGRQDVSGLPVTELYSGVWLKQVVDACRAAADVRFRDLAHLQIRDGPQHASWFGADALCVAQVAGVVIGDPERHRVPRCSRLQVGEQRHPVADRQPVVDGELDAEGAGQRSSI